MHTELMTLMFVLSAEKDCGDEFSMMNLHQLEPLILRLPPAAAAGACLDKEVTSRTVKSIDLFICNKL